MYFVDSQMDLVLVAVVADVADVAGLAVVADVAGLAVVAGIAGVRTKPNELMREPQSQLDVLPHNY